MAGAEEAGGGGAGAALNFFKMLPLSLPQDTPVPAAAHAEAQPVNSDQVGVALLACRVELLCLPLAALSFVLIVQGRSLSAAHAATYAKIPVKFTVGHSR